MTVRSALARIAKTVAGEMTSDRLSPATQFAIRSLEETPEHVFDLVELMAKEGAKKRPNDDLIGAYAFLLAHGLEILRYAVERDEAGAIALVERLRRHLSEYGEKGRISPPLLLLVLHQFAGAKLEVGDALRELMQRLMEADTDAQAASERGEGADHLARIARELGGDPFAIHTYLDEGAEAMPEELRAGIVMAAFGEKEPAVREAALGFLLNGSSLARTKLAELIELAAPHGLVSPTMLRRMIAIRNWMPAADRPALDKAIKACRKKGAACASWPRPMVREVLASGVDGSGAHTILVIVGEAGKHAIAGLLVKQGVGVRDAWVRRGATDAELRELLAHVSGEIAIAPSTVDYVSATARHFLSTNAQSGVMPPFGLLDFAETVGLTDLNPDALPVDRLVATLCNSIDPARLSEAAIAKTLRDSADLPDEHPTLATWFEHDADVDKLLGAKRLPRAKQMAALLTGPLQDRRHRWAEIAAWTSFALKHQPAGKAWEDFAILAKELLGKRPLGEIGIMKVIADTTLAVIGVRGSPGSRHAA